jgi:hypothetical protein
MPMPLTLLGQSWSATTAATAGGRRADGGADRSNPPSAGRFRTERMRWSEARLRSTTAEAAAEAGGEAATRDR